MLRTERRRAGAADMVWGDTLATSKAGAHSGAPGSCIVIFSLYAAEGFGLQDAADSIIKYPL